MSEVRAGSSAKEVFRKTRMCRFHQMGTCRRRGACNFAHSPEEVTEPDPSFAKLCKKLQKTGRCPYGAECPFAHAPPEAARVAGGRAEAAGSPPLHGQAPSPTGELRFAYSRAPGAASLAPASPVGAWPSVTTAPCFRSPMYEPPLMACLCIPIAPTPPSSNDWGPGSFAEEACSDRRDYPASLVRASDVKPEVEHDAGVAADASCGGRAGPDVPSDSWSEQSTEADADEPLPGGFEDPDQREGCARASGGLAALAWRSLSSTAGALGLASDTQNTFLEFRELELCDLPPLRRLRSTGDCPSVAF